METSQQWWLERASNNETIDDKVFNSIEWINSDVVLLLFTIYAIVIFSGAFGNCALIFSICSQPLGRQRKPLLFALCLADLLVVTLSAPLSIVLQSLASSSWPLHDVGCKMMHYFKVSKISLTVIH